MKIRHLSKEQKLAVVKDLSNRLRGIPLDVADKIVELLRQSIRMEELRSEL